MEGMDVDEHRPHWIERITSPDFWIIAGPVLFFLAVFILVLID